MPHNLPKLKLGRRTHMKTKLLTIGVWYIFFMGLLVGYLICLNKYVNVRHLIVEESDQEKKERLFNRWGNSKLLRTSVDTPRPNEPYIVSDSAGIVADGYAKAIFPGATAHHMVRKVDMIPRVDYPFHIVIMAGISDLRNSAQKPQIERGLEELNEKLHASFPQCPTTIINPIEVYRIAAIHGADKWHMDEKGFAILKDHYPVLNLPKLADANSSDK